MIHIKSLFLDLFLKCNLNELFSHDIMLFYIKSRGYLVGTYVAKFC